MLWKFSKKETACSSLRSVRKSYVFPKPLRKVRPSDESDSYVLCHYCMRAFLLLFYVNITDFSYLYLVLDTNVKFAYGWVDLDTPGGIPMEVIIGLARDPVMLTCLRVTNVADSAKFFIEQLGMKVLPFPLSRAKGSTFEPEQVPGSQYIGYSDNSMGLMLTPSPKLKAPPLVVGTMLEAFTLVYDDSAGAASKLPPAVVKVLGGAPNIVKSPDGYSFVLKGYEQFKKEATDKVEF